MNKKFFVIFVYTFTFGIVFPATKADAENSLNPKMNRMAQELVQLWPYVDDPMKFSAPENDKQIAEHIHNLKKAIENASHQRKLSQGDYQQTIELLLGHIIDTEKTFKRGQKDFARYMTQSTLQACIACHSRMPGPESWIPIATNKKTDLFSQAEFLFATRQFHEAQEHFQKLIAGYPKNKLKLDQVLDSLEYLATIYVRIDRAPKQGAKAFQKIAARKNLPPFVQEDIEIWTENFRAWASEPAFVVKDHTDSQILAKAKDILGAVSKEPFYMSDQSKNIFYLRASSLLHELLTEKPKTPFAAEAYYLLGVCYVSVRQNFFMGFDQMYLKTCLKNYPRDPIAKKCYNLLEESIYLGYSGSSGTNVPYDVMQELNQYRKRVY